MQFAILLFPIGNFLLNAVVEIPCWFTNRCQRPSNFAKGNGRDSCCKLNEWIHELVWYSWWYPTIAPVNITNSSSQPWRSVCCTAIALTTDVDEAGAEHSALVSLALRAVPGFGLVCHAASVSFGWALLGGIALDEQVFDLCFGDGGHCASGSSFACFVRSATFWSLSICNGKSTIQSSHRWPLSQAYELNWLWGLSATGYEQHLDRVWMLRNTWYLQSLLKEIVPEQYKYLKIRYHFQGNC